MASPFLADGQLSWSAGVNSLKPTTIVGPNMPDGMPRTGLCWLNNGSVRDGGISPRGGWNYLGTFHNSNGLYQGRIIYEPVDNSPPYFLIAISGHILQVYPDNPGQMVDLSAKFNLYHPAALDYFYFIQAEQFVVIQAGDLVTLPLFWDGSVLRRSKGVHPTDQKGTQFPVVTSAVFQIPAVGQSVIVSLTAPYPGVVGDTIVLYTPFFVISQTTNETTTTSFGGIFNVTAKSANTVTLLAVNTPYVGDRVPVGNATLQVVTAQLGDSELPAAGPMDYFMGRIWYAQGQQYIAGDIVGGPSGTLALGFNDAVLKVTENPLAIGGDGFSVVSSSGNIRAIKHTSQIDASLGQGQLLIATQKAIYKLDVPVARTDWVASGTSSQPRQTILQLNNGSVNDRAMINVNGDMFYMSLEPSIRSLIWATRFFGEWGNRSVSANEQRVMQFNDRNLLRFASGMMFDNRLFMTALPTQTPQGVVHKGLVPLDFLPVSGFMEQGEPIWHGIHEGLDFLQLGTTGFNGLERALAIVRLQDGSFSIWEMSTVGRFDNNVIGESRINWSMEFPAFTWGQEWLLKKLVSAELWIDRLFGEVVFTLEYRPDGETCWRPWHTWKACSARNSAEDCVNPITYPLQPYGDGYKQTMVLPKPPVSCEPFSQRPSDVAYQQQCRLTIRGYCRVRGFMLYAEPVERALYKGLIC